MKKFMIFLLMTFLYLGTCQARSEASYPKDANLKLLSWVSPTPSQSFLTRSNATGTFDITPSSTVHLGVTSNKSVTFSRPVGAVLESLPGWPAGATVNTVDWKVDGSTFKTGGNTCVVEGLNVGNHTFNCELKLSNGDVWTSNTVNIIVAEENIMLTIVGATHACESDVVTLTAVINGQVQGHTYQWKVDGEAIPGATGQTYSFIPDTLLKTAIENENLSHEFTVEVNRDGCLQTVSPIHPFVILLKPELVLNFPEYVCENSTYNIDAFLSGSNSTIQPYQWKWFKNNTLYATTSEATLSLEAIEENLNAEWAVYALFEDLACATDTAKMPADTVKFFTMPSNLSVNLQHEQNLSYFCVNSDIKFYAHIIDNSSSNLGNATYKWYASTDYGNNYELVAITNGNNYDFSYSNPGQYVIKVDVFYENYPCDSISDATEIVIEQIPDIAIVGNNVLCAGDTTNLGVVPVTNGLGTDAFLNFYNTITTIQWFSKGEVVAEGVPTDVYSGGQVALHKVSEPGVYVATVYTAGGCTASAEFTVYQFGADLQVTASEMLVCPGTTVTLNANADGWNNENIKYEWNTGDTSSTISAVVDRDSVFTVTASAGDNCSLVQTINVKAIPAENIQLTVKAEVDTICVGGRVKATIENADSDYQGFYTWYLNGIEVAGANLDTIFFDVNNAGIYSVAATLSNFSCGADTVSAVDTFVVVGGNTLVLAGDNVICPGDTAVVFATKIDGAKYTWLGPNVENANNDTLRTAVPGIYALTVEDTLYGCPALTADFTINQVGADLQVYASDVLVCPGTKVTVRANLDGFSNWNVAYAWSTEDTTSAAIATVSTDTTFVVTAFVTAPNSNNVCSLTDSINVFVYDTTSVQLDVNATPENICQGSQVNLKVRPIITSDATVAAPESYIWYINGVEIPGQNLDSVILSLNEPGSYEFSVRPANQVCKVQPATYAHTPVTVYAIPDMYIAGDFVICTGDTAYLAPIIQPADDKFTFTWNTGSTDSLLKVTEAGVYHVYAVGDKGKCYANASFSVTTFGGDLHVSADKYVVCESEMVVLTANLDGMQNENIKYAWSQNVKGTITNLDTTSTLQVYPTDTTTYIVTAIAGNCTMVDSVTVNVILTPTMVDLTVSALEDTVCVGSQATISVASNDNHSYVWYQNGVVIPGENLSAITVNLNEPGMYVYAATPANTACVVSSTEAMDTIWVFANPEVALTGNSVICNGDTAKILATVLNGNPADYTYLWSNNDNDSLLNVVEAGIYTVTVTNKNTKCEATADVAVTKFGGDLHVSADKYVVCESEMVVLTANLDGMQNENIKYAWSQNVKGTITNLDTTSTLQVYPTDTTTYIVTAIAGNCSMVDSVTVNVILTPTTVNLTVSALEDTVCVGGQATISVASNDNHSYVWYQNGVVISGENLSAITVNLNEPGMYVYAATPANTACVVSSTEAMDTIWVFANPEVALTGNSVICNGDTAKILATVLNGNPADYTYLWSNNDNDSLLNVVEAGIYTVTVTNKNTKCEATADVAVTTFGGDLHVSADKYSVCESEMVVLTANIDGMQNENIKYAWSQNVKGTITNLDTTSTLQVYPTDTTTYIVTAIAGNCSMVDSVTVNVILTPTTVDLTVSALEDTVCVGSQATVSVASTDNHSYVWYQNGVVIPGENLSAITVSLNEPGMYVFAATPANVSCVVSNPEHMDTVWVFANPELALTGNSVICNGDTAKILATVLNGNPVDYTYLWSNNDNDSLLNVVEAGIYTVTVTNKNTKCEATAEVSVTTFGGDLHVSADKYEVCESEMVVLTANLDGMQNENIKYAWSQNVKGTVTDLDTTSTLQVYPTDTTTYIVTAIAGNCTMVDSVTVNVIKTPTTVDLTVSALEDTICVGGQATVSVASTDNHSYVWYQNGVVIPGENLSTITVNLNEPGMYVYAATPANTACVVSSTEAMDTIWVFANPEVFITGDHFYTVNADSAKIFANKIENAKYLWSNGATTDSIVVADAAIYTLTVTDTLTGCSTTVDYKVDAVVNLQAHIAGVEEACMSDVVTLTAVVDHDLIGVKYQWMIDGQYINGQTDQHYTFKTDTLYENTGLLTHDIQVELSREGCENVKTPVFKFKIRPVPMAVVSAPEYICKDDSATLEAVVYALGQEEEYEYVWFKNDENTVFANPATGKDTTEYINTIVIKASELKDNKFAVKVLYQDTACASNISNFVEVKIYEEPDKIHLTVNADTVCTDAQVNYTVENLSTKYTLGQVNWFVNGVQVENAHDTLYANNYANPGVYHVYATVEYTDYPCEILTTQDTTIYVFEQPTVQITGDPIICTDSLVSLFAMINDTIGSKDYNYEWRLYNYTLADGENNPEFVVDNTTANENVTIKFLTDSVNLTTHLKQQDHPYIFTTTVTTQHGCKATSEPYYVYVGANPTVAVTVEPDTVCKGGIVTATAHLGDYNMDNLTYQWYENGTLKDHGTSRIYTASVDSNTVFSVTVTQTTTGCTAEGKDSTYVLTPKNIDNIVLINNGQKAKNICEGAQLYITAYFKDDHGQLYVDSTLYYNWTVNGMSIHDAFGLADPHGAGFSVQAYIYDGDPVDYVFSATVVYPIEGCDMESVNSDTVHVKRNPRVYIDGTPNVCYYSDQDNNIVLTAWVDGELDEDATYTWFESGQYRPNTSGYDNKYAASWPPTYLNPYIFTVEVTNGDGCTSYSDPFYVNVYDIPVVNILSNADSICFGGSVELSAKLDNNNDPMMTFQWYENRFDDLHKLPGYTDKDVIVTPTTLGETSYIVRATHLTYYGNQSCFSLDTFKILVNNAPVVDSITDNVPDTNVVCDGYQVEMTAHISGGVAGGEVYTWYRNNEKIEGATQAHYTEVVSAQNNEPTTYTYAVEVAQSADACESVRKEMDAFTVNPNPVVKLTTDPIVCVEKDSNIMLVANVYPAPETEVKFNWFEDNAVIKSNTVEDTIYLSREYRDFPYSFSVELVNEYACSSVSNADVYVMAEPVVNITVTEDSICVGGEITLTASLDDWNAEQLTFQWADNNVDIDGATSLTYTVKPTEGIHEYTVTVKQLTSLCEATSDSVVVVVNPRPVITSVTSDKYTICAGGQLEISAHLADTVEGEVFTWYKNGTIIPGAVTSTIYDSPELVDNNTQTYVYAAEVTRPAAGCTSVRKEASVVTVYPNPTVVITGDQHVCETDSIFLIANVDTIGHGVGNLHYTWYQDGMIRDNMGYNLGDNHFFAEGDMRARVEPYRYTVEVRRENDATGCVSKSDVFDVYVYTQPVVNIIPSETEICTEGQVTLYASLNDNNASDLVYQWYKLVETEQYLATGYNDDDTEHIDTVKVINRVNIPGATLPTFTTNVNETTTFGVMVLQTPSTCTANNEVTINVNPRPIVTNVTVNAESEVTVCDGAQVSIAATIEPASAEGAIFTWFRNGEMIENVNGASFNENVYTNNNHVTVNTYQAIVTLPASGCMSMMSDSAAVVTVKPRPSTVTISGNSLICENDSTVLTAYSDVEGTFIWSNGVTDTNKITVAAGEYFVTMKTAEGCELTSDLFTVVAKGTQVLATASEYVICQGENTTLFAEQTGWEGNVTFKWDANADNAEGNSVTVSPDTTTTYLVTATVNSTNGTCSVTAPVTIIVNKVPAKVNVTPSANQVCEGSQVTFSADGNAFAYQWYENDVIIPGENLANLIVNFNEEGIYVYKVKAISEEGCVSLETSDPDTVVVNAAPESVIVTGGLVICNGGETTLFANVTPNVANVTYQWYKDNVAIANSNNHSLVVTTPGSYKVAATTNNCTTTSDAVVVTVEQAPQLELTATEYTICVDGETVITAEATGYNNQNVILNWSNGFQGTQYTFNPTVEGTYKFVVTASHATPGCVATDSVIITVNNKPNAPSITADYNTICEGGQVNLTITNAVSGATYTWFENNIEIVGAHQSTLPRSPIAVDGDVTTYSYKAIATLPGSGCSSYITPVAAIVTVIPTPVVAVSVNGNTTLCDSGSTTLVANVTPANATYSYQWYKDNVIIPGATDATYDIVDLAARETAYNYSVVVTANPGCVVPSEATAITVVADPVVVATISENTSCVGGVVTLTVTPQGGVDNVNGLNPYTYEWYSNLSTTTPIANTATFTTTGNETAGNYSYWAVVKSVYGCETMSNVVNHVVVPDPTVAIAVAQGYPEAICDGGSTTLIANVNGGVGTASYTWYKNGIELYGENNPTLVTGALEYGKPAAYTVVVTMSGVDCEATSAAYNVTVGPSYTVDITGNGNVCQGGTLNLEASVNNVLDGDQLTYQWHKIFNGVDVAINGATSKIFSTSDLLLGDSYEYYVVVTSTISGCSVASTTVPANVVAAPSVTINGAHTVCAGGDLVLNAQVTGGVPGAAYTYTWNWTGAEVGSATVATSSYVPTLNAASDASAPYYFTVTVQRNDNTGCTATSTEAHEVNVMPVPTVNVTVDNQYVCQGGNVTFTAHVTPAGAYDYAWTINGVAQLVNSNAITTTLATSGTINASVVVKAANTSSSCDASAQIAVPVTVVALPTASISVSNDAMCVGGTTTLTANINSANNNIPSNYTYQWYRNGSILTGAVSKSIIEALNEAGKYEYTVVVSQNSELGCVTAANSVAPVTVQVAEQPVVALSSVDGLAICEGGDITLTATVTNYGNSVNGTNNSDVYGDLTFDWFSNGVSVDHNTDVANAQDQQTYTLNNVGNYSYQVVVTPQSGYNCQPQVSNIEVVNVVSNPSWTEVHIYSSNGTDACLGDMVTLQAAIQGGAVDYVGSTNGYIQWTVTDASGNTMNVSGGLGGDSYDIPAVAGTYMYTPTFVGNIGSGCQLSNTSNVQVAVTVHELPTAEFTSGDGTALCANDPSASAALVIAFTGVAPFHYQVVTTNGEVVKDEVSLTNTVTIYVAPTEQTTYRIAMVEDAFCVNTALQTSATATVTVNKVEFDETMFVSGCNDNGEVTINFNMIHGNPAANFTVVYDNGLQASGTISNNTATFAAPSVPGDYHAVFTVDGCSYDIVVRVLVGDYSFAGSTMPIMDIRWNDVVVVNNNSATNGGHTFVGFQWYKNGVAIPGATYSNYQEKGGLNGFYSVELIEKDENGNMVTYMTCETYFSSVSLVKVYPVPANVRQEITIELDLTSEELEGAVLDIYSVTGAHISHVTDLQPITKIEGFRAQGTYFGRILTGTNEIKTVKFVIVK